MQFDAGWLNEESAIEVIDPLVSSSLHSPFRIHRGEEAAEEIVTVPGRLALFEQLDDEIPIQEPDIFGEEGYQHLQYKSAGRLPVHILAAGQLVKAAGQQVGGVTRHCFVVVAEDGALGSWEEKSQWPVAGAEFLDFDCIDRRVNLRLEVVYPEFVEVAQNHVSWPAGDKASPVIESLTKVPRQVFPASLHFDENHRLPDVIGESGAPAIFLRLANAEFGSAANVETAGLAEALKETVKKDLRLPLFVTGDVFRRPGDELA
ncbi:MAG: hypothetical protein IAF94_12830 [Pirellulaceae bacterium]|nr:hypothetical protein [Pirellulaceae bacterium]